MTVFESNFEDEKWGIQCTIWAGIVRLYQSGSKVTIWCHCVVAVVSVVLWMRERRLRNGMTGVVLCKQQTDEGGRRTKGQGSEMMMTFFFFFFFLPIMNWVTMTHGPWEIGRTCHSSDKMNWIVTSWSLRRNEWVSVTHSVTGQVLRGDVAWQDGTLRWGETKIRVGALHAYWRVYMKRSVPKLETGAKKFAKKWKLPYRFP